MRRLLDMLWKRREIAPDPAGKYVVSLRTTGLGDKLICLCAAWIFARNTGRTLIVDWRHSSYSRFRSNLFSTCFSNRTEIAGIPLIAGPYLDTSNLPLPIFPPFWSSSKIAAPWKIAGDGPPDERDAMVALIRRGLDISAPTVAFRACVNDGVVSFNDARDFLEGLQITASVAAKVENFMRHAGPPRPWIGLHVRHGNGGNIDGHANSWVSFSNAIDRCSLAVGEARRRHGLDVPVLLCTDSVDVEIAARKAIPNLIVRPKKYRRSGKGELHAGRSAPDGLDDALTEMVLLSKCETLIRYPASSFFSWYPAVMKPRSTPHPASVYDLQMPWDPADPMSPAVVF